MLLVNVNYISKKDNIEIMLSRTINDNDDFRMVIGETLYGVEVQCKSFKTDDIFKKYNKQIPDKFDGNRVIFEEYIGDDITLSASITGGLGAKKPRAKKAASKTSVKQ